MALIIFENPENLETVRNRQGLPAAPARTLRRSIPLKLLAAGLLWSLSVVVPAAPAPSAWDLVHPQNFD